MFEPVRIIRLTVLLSFHPIRLTFWRNKRQNKAWSLWRKIDCCETERIIIVLIAAWIKLFDLPFERFTRNVKLLLLCKNNRKKRLNAVRIIVDWKESNQTKQITRPRYCRPADSDSLRQSSVRFLLFLTLVAYLYNKWNRWWYDKEVNRIATSNRSMRESLLVWMNSTFFLQKVSCCWSNLREHCGRVVKRSSSWRACLYCTSKPCYQVAKKLARISSLAPSCRKDELAEYNPLMRHDPMVQ